MEESPKVRVGTVKCAYYMPLEKANEGPARGDEVAIFVLNPRQAMYLARGTLYSRGGICLRLTGPGTCQSVIAGPFCTRQPMYSLGCFGARQFMKITGNEMWFGVPIEQLALLADGRRVLLERARTSRRRWMSRSIRSMSSRNTSWMYRRRRAS